MSNVNPRAVARKVLKRVWDDGAYATLALDGELSSAGLEERDRRFVSELVYGVLRNLTRIDDTIAQYTKLVKAPPPVRIALRVATYQLHFLERVPDYAAVDDAVAAAKRFGGQRLAGFTNAVLRKVASGTLSPLPNDPVKRALVEASLPAWIGDEIAQVVPASELADAIAAFSTKPPLTLRVNTLKSSVAEVVAELGREGLPFTHLATSEHAITVEGFGDPSLHPLFLQGKVSIQDAGAQRVAASVKPQAGEVILDLCAGVGGKSLHLAALMDDRGEIHSVDTSASKLNLCEQAAKRLGVTNLKLICHDLLHSEHAALAREYDRVLLDAPCTGLGVLRRHPDAKHRLQPAAVPDLVALQQSLLAACAKRVRSGGFLTYSVCSFTKREGEGQVADFVARHPEFVLEHTERTWPHRDGGDAFFLASLRKR